MKSPRLLSSNTSRGPTDSSENPRRMRIAVAESAIQKSGGSARADASLPARRVQAALAKKGAEKTPADILAELNIDDRLDSAELTLVRERMALDQAKIKQDVLQTHAPKNGKGTETRSGTHQVGRARQNGDLGAGTEQSQEA